MEYKVLNSAEDPAQAEDLLKQIRAAAGRLSRYGRKTVIEKTGIDKHSLSKFINGKKDLTFINTVKLCSCLFSVQLVLLKVPGENQAFKALQGSSLNNKY